MSERQKQHLDRIQRQQANKEKQRINKELEEKYD